MSDGRTGGAASTTELNRAQHGLCRTSDGDNLGNAERLAKGDGRGLKPAVCLIADLALLVAEDVALGALAARGASFHRCAATAE